MFTQIQDYVSDNTSAIVDHMAKLRQESADNVREVFSSSADSLKSLKSPVRTLARSGIKLTNVAQSTTQSLIELQSDVVTATITDAAKRLERAARASNIVDLVQAQVDMLPAPARASSKKPSVPSTSSRTTGQGFARRGELYLRPHHQAGRRRTADRERSPRRRPSAPPPRRSARRRAKPREPLPRPRQPPVRPPPEVELENNKYIDADSLP